MMDARANGEPVDRTDSAHAHQLRHAPQQRKSVWNWVFGILVLGLIGFLVGMLLGSVISA